MDINACKIKLGARIKALREEQGLSQSTLALMANASQVYISKIETGQGNASTSVLCRIADALGVQVRDLIEF